MKKMITQSTYMNNIPFVCLFLQITPLCVQILGYLWGEMEGVQKMNKTGFLGP
jgi:hypothetical protein